MFDRINEDIKTAMRAKEKEKLTALRYLKSILTENKTSKKPRPEMDVVIGHVKKLKDSLNTFPSDSELYKQAEKEIEILSIYLPQPLSREEVESLVTEIKAKFDAPKMGDIMKELQPQIKGRFDGKIASEIVKNALN